MFSALFTWYIRFPHCTHILGIVFGFSKYSLRNRGARLPELGTAATHNLVLADQLGAEFTAVQGKVNVEVHPVEDTLWCVHALEIGLEVLAREIRSEGDDLLDTCKKNISGRLKQGGK